VRTTLSLDDDVAAKLRAEVRRTGRPFKEIVNEALRLGLAPRKAPGVRRRFRVQARSLRHRRGLDYDRTSALIEHIEGALGR
jgi:Ribbon-helix-helix protein, copG family